MSNQLQRKLHTHAAVLKFGCSWTGVLPGTKTRNDFGRKQCESGEQERDSDDQDDEEDEGAGKSLKMHGKTNGRCEAIVPEDFVDFAATDAEDIKGMAVRRGDARPP